MDFRTMMRDDFEGGWARGKLSLWKVISLAILSPEHLQNDKWLKMLAKKAGPRMAMNCQLYCYEILSFYILFWDHISFFNETCLLFVSLLFWSQKMFSISFLTKYFDQTPTCN
jgi:hypothetical protein